MGDVMALMNASGKSIGECAMTPAALAALVKLSVAGTINGPTLKELLPEIFEKGGDPEQIVKERGLGAVSDTAALEAFVDQAIAANPGPVQDYKNGKKAAAGFFVGQVMKLSKGKADPKIVGGIVAKKLSALALSLVAAMLVLLVGCTSFRPQQACMFTDANGNIVTVEYGNSKKDHVSKFTAPNGKVLDMKTKLGVRVTLPAGDDFLAWECMNTLSVGTMYRTDNQKWLYHANGISCRVFKKALNPSTGQDDYLEIFEGVICEGPGDDRE